VSALCSNGGEIRELAGEKYADGVVLAA